MRNRKEEEVRSGDHGTSRIHISHMSSVKFPRAPSPTYVVYVSFKVLGKRAGNYKIITGLD